MKYGEVNKNNNAIVTDSCFIHEGASFTQGLDLPLLHFWRNVELKILFDNTVNQESL